MKTSPPANRPSPTNTDVAPVRSAASKSPLQPNPQQRSATQQQRMLAQELLATTGGDIQKAVAVLQEYRHQTTVQKLQKAAQPHSDQVVIDVDHISKRYKVGKQHINALNDVSLQVYKGEFLAITGTSGSGKSTLLQLIGGLDKPSQGSITVQAQNLAKLRDGKLSHFRNKTIGFVFQFFYLQPFLNLQTNVEVPAMFARTRRRDRHSRSAELAASVDLSDRLKHLPRELSGGQMQRAAIARALQNNPSILLADEPTGNLDRTNALAIFELFRKIRDERGTTVIVVTHDLELASNADRIISMSDGGIVS